MSAWFFIIGLVLLWAGVGSRLARRERRSLELAALNYPIKVAGVMPKRRACQELSEGASQAGPEYPGRWQADRK